MTDTPDATTPAEAINAARNAVASKLFDIGMWAPADADVIFADAALAAAAPLIAARATAEPRWHCTADPATVPCGRCVACRCDHADAYQAGRVAERERIRQLAIDTDAIYTQCENPDCEIDHLDLPFADLLGGASHSATTEGNTP